MSNTYHSTHLSRSCQLVEAQEVFYQRLLRYQIVEAPRYAKGRRLDSLKKAAYHQLKVVPSREYRQFWLLAKFRGGHYDSKF